MSPPTCALQSYAFFPKRQGGNSLKVNREIPMATHCRLLLGGWQEEADDGGDVGDADSAVGVTDEVERRRLSGGGGQVGNQLVVLQARERVLLAADLFQGGAAGDGERTADEVGVVAEEAYASFTLIFLNKNTPLHFLHRVADNGGSAAECFNWRNIQCDGGRRARHSCMGGGGRHSRDRGGRSSRS